MSKSLNWFKSLCWSHITGKKLKHFFHRTVTLQMWNFVHTYCKPLNDYLVHEQYSQILHFKRIFNSIGSCQWKLQASLMMMIESEENSKSEFLKQGGRVLGKKKSFECIWPLWQRSQPSRVCSYLYNHRILEWFALE